MKYYLLQSITTKNGRAVCRRFKSRNDAINYMMDKLSLPFSWFGPQIEEERPIFGDKHSIEYICDDYSRFIVTRIVQ